MIIKIITIKYYIITLQQLNFIKKQPSFCVARQKGGKEIALTQSPSPASQAWLTFQLQPKRAGGQSKRSQRNTGLVSVKSGLSLQTQRQSIHAAHEWPVNPRTLLQGVALRQAAGGRGVWRGLIK